ncbi:MAG: (Fe-S)-binding protein [Marinifilaceae bacterium]|nr:(Fe-S)-binding protein [Marinifilaceae bacterium]
MANQQSSTGFFQRLRNLLVVGIFQSRILNKPLSGFSHALVFWGFLVISIASIEIIIDGVFGSELSFSELGGFYYAISYSVDIMSYIVIIACSVFLVRRLINSPKRFQAYYIGIKEKFDAIFCLLMIVFLCSSLIYVNIYHSQLYDYYPVSGLFSFDIQYYHYKIIWWAHILGLFLFALYLPFSKHFHVYLSLFNVFSDSTNSYAYYPSLKSIRAYVRQSLGFETEIQSEDVMPERFGVFDVSDISKKNYLDSLSCTQCGRCSQVCPAVRTGKKLSPRKIFIDVRYRMNEYYKNKDSENTLVDNYITSEEIWACTTCNACSEVCPVNIRHANLIMNMRRNYVMDRAEIGSDINLFMRNMETKQCPWDMSPEQRLSWFK